MSALPSPLKSPAVQVAASQQKLLTPESQCSAPLAKAVPLETCRNSFVSQDGYWYSSAMSALPSPVKSPATSLMFAQFDTPAGVVFHAVGSANVAVPGVPVATNTRICQVALPRSYMTARSSRPAGSPSKLPATTFMFAMAQVALDQTSVPSRALPSERCTLSVTVPPCCWNTATSVRPSPSKSPVAVRVWLVGYAAVMSCGAIGLCTPPVDLVSSRH